MVNRWRHIARHMKSIEQKVLCDSDRCKYPIKQFILSHIIASITMACQSLWRTSHVNSKITSSNAKKIKILRSESWVYKKWQTLVERFLTRIWRLGDMVQNLESPGFSGRVDSTGYLPYIFINKILTMELLNHLKNVELLMKYCYWDYL